jgi:hypothetical protein
VIFGSVPPVIRPTTEIAKEREAENLEKVKEVKEALEDDEPSEVVEAEPTAQETKTEDLEDDVAALRSRRRPSKTIEPEPEPEAVAPEPEPEPEPAPAPAEDESTPEQATAGPRVDAQVEPPVEESQPEPSVDVAELKRKLAEAEAEAEKAKAEVTEPEPEPEPVESPAKGASEDLKRRLDGAEKAKAPAGVDEESGEIVDPEAFAAEQAAEEAVEAEAVPEEGTPVEQPVEEVDAETGLHVCEQCGEAIENEDVAELSYIRYQQHLCPEHFAERKKARGRK